MRVKEVSTDDRIYDMYLDYREDGLSPEEAKLAVARSTEYDYEAVEDVLKSYNIEESKTMKRNKKESKETETITIKEEVQIPGTGVILEKGDKIEVDTSKKKVLEQENDEYKLNAKRIVGHVEEDSYEEGALPGTGGMFLDEKLNETFNSFESMKDWLSSTFNLPEDKDAWAVFDAEEGRIDVQDQVNMDMMEPSSRDWERFRRGEINLFIADYSIYVELVKKYEPSPDELQRITGLQLI